MIDKKCDFVSSDTTYTPLCQLMTFQRFEGQLKSHQVNVLGVVVDVDEAAPAICKISDSTIYRTVDLRGGTEKAKLEKGDCVLLRNFTVCNQKEKLPYLRQKEDEDHCGSWCIWKGTCETLYCSICHARFEDCVLEEMTHLRTKVKLWMNH